ncbi:acyltransferase [Clostridium sp. DJ247]|uniref:acyltransferase n=1 Tax=Clostridium sp. DJ247 TaxID=2726188 RepID=UPI00162913CD|nr:acyltransferase [Clostridium sp. DJ247]MBC2581998.1 acyltransferase [Clostridium sp. DJ247]
MSRIDNLLYEIEDIVKVGITKEDVANILSTLGCSFPAEFIEEIQLYGDYLPKNKEIGFSEKKRYLHFLWDVLDKSPMCLVANFAIPFRRILAKKLFKSCGENFIAEENVRFNIPDNIEIGDNVFLNRGTFIDSKGGVLLGNSVVITEGVTIFTHSHTEHDHSLRTYAPVIVKDYVKIYSNSTILPGVTIGEQSIVGACSLINKSVEPNVLVAGVPAKQVRNRETFDNSGDQLKHIWLYNSEFQND